MGAYLEWSWEFAGHHQRGLYYDRSEHGRLLVRVANDWNQEFDGRLRRRPFLSSDPLARLGSTCGEHLRHGLRADVQIDFARRAGVAGVDLHPRDICEVATITAAATWSLELATLLLAARSRSWITRNQRSAVVKRIRRLPPSLMWPVDSKLFRYLRDYDRSVTKACIGREREPETRVEAKAIQRRFAMDLRQVRSEMDRDAVVETLGRLGGWR